MIECGVVHYIVCKCVAPAPGLAENPPNLILNQYYARTHTHRHTHTHTHTHTLYIYI